MPSASSVSLLHRVLGIGLVTVGSVFVVLAYVGVVPLLGDDGAGLVIAYAFSGIGFVVTAIALLLLKPRVPERRVGQSVEQYWSTPDVRAKVLPVWFLLEGATMVAAVGYLLTGELAAAIVAGAGIVAFWISGPQAFTKE